MWTGKTKKLPVSKLCLFLGLIRFCWVHRGFPLWKRIFRTKTILSQEMGSSVNRISLNGGHQLQTLLMSIIVFSSELIRDNFARYFRVVIIALQDRDWLFRINFEHGPISNLELSLRCRKYIRQKVNVCLPFIVSNSPLKSSVTDGVPQNVNFSGERRAIKSLMPDRITFEEHWQTTDYKYQDSTDR